MSMGLACAFVMHGNDISAAVCNNAGYVLELPRFVDQLYAQRAGAAGFEQAALDYAGKDRYVDVSAGNEAAHLFALNGQLVKHGGGHADCAGALRDQAMLFDQRKDRRGNFVFGYGYNIVYIFAAIFKGVYAGSFTAMPSAIVETLGRRSMRLC